MPTLQEVLDRKQKNGEPITKAEMDAFIKNPYQIVRDTPPTQLGAVLAAGGEAAGPRVKSDEELRETTFDAGKSDVPAWLGLQGVQPARGMQTEQPEVKSQRLEEVLKKQPLSDNTTQPRSLRVPQVGYARNAGDAAGGLEAYLNKTRDAAGAVSPAVSPEEAWSKLDAATKKAEGGKRDSDEYKQNAAALGDIKKQMAELRADKADARGQTMWMQAAETIAHALTKYAAARYGLDHNVDAVSGIKMQPTDWQKIMQGSVDDINQQLEHLRGQEAGIEKRQEKMVDEAGQLGRSAYMYAEETRRRAEDAVRQGKWQEAEALYRKAQMEQRDRELQLEASYKNASLAAQALTQQEVKDERAQRQKEAQLGKLVSRQKIAGESRARSEEEAVTKQLGGLTKLQEYADAEPDIGNPKNSAEFSKLAVESGMLDAGKMTKEDWLGSWSKKQFPDKERLQRAIAERQAQLGRRLENIRVGRTQLGQAMYPDEADAAMGLILQGSPGYAGSSSSSQAGGGSGGNESQPQQGGQMVDVIKVSTGELGQLPASSVRQAVESGLYKYP